MVLKKKRPHLDPSQTRVPSLYQHQTALVPPFLHSADAGGGLVVRVREPHKPQHLNRKKQEISINEPQHLRDEKERCQPINRRPVEHKKKRYQQPQHLRDENKRYQSMNCIPEGIKTRDVN